MKTLASALVLLLSAFLPAQTLNITNPLGQVQATSHGSPNGCGTYAGHFAQVSSLQTLPFCAQNINCARLGNIMEVAGAAGFLWPAGTEGPGIWFAVEIAPSATCFYPVPAPVFVPGSATQCGNLFMTSSTVLSPQFSAQIVTGGGGFMSIYWVPLFVPSNTAFVGNWIVSQTIHLNPGTGLFQWSGRHETPIVF